MSVYSEGEMKYIKKEEIIETLQRMIDARKNKNCSRQTIIERKAFEYALAVVEKLEEHEFN